MDSICRAFVQGVLATSPVPLSVVEIGSRSINGVVRDLFPAECAYLGIDCRPGPNVDVVSNGEQWQGDGRADVVLCLNVFEHTPRWGGLIANAYTLLQTGGQLVLAMATDPWPPHSGEDGGAVRPGEWYQNIDPLALLGMTEPFFQSWRMEQDAVGHLFLVAVKAT